MADYGEQFPRGNCQNNARWMTLIHPELSEVEGYLVFAGPEQAEWRTEHTWNETPDGQVVDSTAWAFAGTLPYRYEPDPTAWVRLAWIAAPSPPSLPSPAAGDPPPG